MLVAYEDWRYSSRYSCMRIMAGFCSSGAEPCGSATRELISKMDLREMGCEDMGGG
jgi:hypothetical protein